MYLQNMYLFQKNLAQPKSEANYVVGYFTGNSNSRMEWMILIDAEMRLFYFHKQSSIMPCLPSFLQILRVKNLK